MSKTKEQPSSEPDRNADGNGTRHPAVGGVSWSADLELGANVHDTIGDYWARIAGGPTADRFRLLVELAGKLYDLHALKRIGLVRPGHVEDASAFDTEHAIRASLAVWQPLANFQLEDAERQAIDRALAASRSRWMGEALRKVTGTANTGNDRHPRPGSQNCPQPRDWSEIAICFLSDERVQVTIGTETQTHNYAEMGFASKKNGTPIEAWGTLRVLARHEGSLRAVADPTVWATYEKRIQEIRRKFKTHFRLAEDPIPFIKKKGRASEVFGYQTKFNISCHPSIEF